MNIKQTVCDAKLHWKIPPLGRYMSYKEIFSLSIGGMGQRFIVYCVQNMILSVGNTLIGNTIGIAPKPLYAIYLISVIASFPLTALRAKIIDNTRNKKGKYRPFIFSMGLPTVILAIAFVWMPYDSMTLLTKCITVLLFNVGFQFFYMFLFDAYESLINVLSPNTIERSDVCSIKSVTDSFAPTIAGILLPLLARLITGENTLFDMKIYRLIYPPMLILGMVLAMLIYFNTEEKIVQAKTHIVQIKFSDAFRAVAKNKYFWIISLAGWLGFLEGSFSNILNWLYNYQEACSAPVFSFITALNGNAALWGMVFAPFLIRRLGKRNILIYSNMLSIIFILAMYPIVTYMDPKKIIWVMLICLFVNGIVTTFGHILNPSLNGDIRDYQQYKTGERIDGMFAAVGLIGSVITLGTSVILPAIYDKAGLNETVAIQLGYDGSNVYDVLYDPTYFKQICGVLILASVVGAILNVIPFFFYDLTELKQKAMITVLKIRALFEDYGNGALSDEDLVQAIDLVNESRDYINRVPVTISKKSINAAKKTKNKEEIKKAKKAHEVSKEHNQKIEIAKFVMKEMNKFDTAEVQQEVKVAREIFKAGLKNLGSINGLSLAEAKALPKGTPEEKEYRKAAIDKAKQEIYSKKVIKKHFPDGVVEFDASIFTKLFETEDNIELKLSACQKALSEAKEQKISELIDMNVAEIKKLKAQKSNINIQIKKATAENSLYSRAAKPYLDARKLLIQQENYRHFDEIAAKYDEAKARAEKAREDKIAEIDRIKAEKDAYTAKIKEEKSAAKNNKKK